MQENKGLSFWPQSHCYSMQHPYNQSTLILLREPLASSSQIIYMEAAGDKIT